MARKSGDLLADNRLETAIQRAQAFGTEGESYSNLFASKCITTNS